MRRCSVTAGGLPVHLIQFSEISNGFNVCIRVASVSSEPQRPIAPGSEAHQFEHFEDITFMQRSLSASASHSHPPQAAAACPAQGSEGAATAAAHTLNPHAPAFVPGLLPIEGMNEFVQDLHRLWLAESFSWEGEQPSALFTTWMVDHSGAFKHCTRPRNIRLGSDFHVWEAQIRAVWRDELVGDPILEFHLVSPTPPRPQNQVVGHIIVIQHADESLVTSLVSVMDNTIRAHHGRTQRMAVTTHEHILLEVLLDVVGYAQVCIPEDSPKVCRAWYFDERMRLQHPLPGRSGYGISINVHLRTRPGPRAMNMLQLSAKILSTPAVNPEGERQTQGQVAHTPGPPQLHLDRLLPEDTTHCTRPVRLIRGHIDVTSLPTFVEAALPISEKSVQHELRCFGHDCKVWVLGEGALAICFPQTWESSQFAADSTHFVFVQMNDSEVTIDPVFHLHSDSSLEIEDHIGMMRFLHQLGYEKAVITSTIRHCHSLVEVQFAVSVGTMEIQTPPIRRPSSWPSPQPVVPHRKLYDPALVDKAHSDCLLNLGANCEQLLSFFEHSSVKDLCQITDGLDLPEVTLSALQELQPLESYDRLIIYTDGSSHSGNLRLAPELIEERSMPDAWSFVVLGEQYTDSGPVLTLLGWCAHQVRCSLDSPWHLGSRAVGSWVAEREALVWAFLWRIGLNSNVPTIFRSDSAMTIGQAQGTLGSQQHDETFEILRGCHQLLEAALPSDGLRVEHVYGHNADPWNEFADHVAKREAVTGFMLSRGPLDVQFWRPLIPYLWMLFGSQYGMPEHCEHGFNVPVPALPAALHSSCTVTQAEPVDVHLTFSIATANVLSLCQRPDGFAGKVNYLREQFVSHGLTFLGLQETRSASGASLVHQVFRLCSGSKKGHHGVELWCNLKQPYGYVQGQPQYLRKSDFAVVHHDDTRLLTKIDARLQTFWILVLHAPHSGQPQQQRDGWWQTTHDLLSEHQVQVEQLFVCADANAAPGPRDDRHVFEDGFATSSSTPLLRNFLQTFDLCLPSTSAIHIGPRHTWTRPDGLTSHLIDYVMVPAAHFQACVHSQLLDHFDLANQTLDHTATGIEMSWWTTLQMRQESMESCGMRIDRGKIQDGHLNEMLNNFQVASWLTDVETQTTSLTNHLHATLQKCCRRDPAQPKKEFVSPFTWELRRQKLFHRKQLKLARTLLLRETLARIFKAWRGADQELCKQSFEFGTSLRCGLFKHLVGFRTLSWGLKKHLEKDKTRKISEVVASFDATTASSEIQHKLKGFMGSTNKLKQGLAPLPAVRTLSGSSCGSAEAILNRWIQFFADMEGGVRVTQQELHDSWVQSLAGTGPSTCHIAISEVPSLCQLEAACRRVKAGKADGPDRVPSEICKFYPKETAKLLYGLLLKLITHGHEPLIHKGGTVVPIWKGKLAKDTCEAFRSILLSSNLGKVIHRTLRVHQRSLYEAFLHAQQLGGRQKVPVTLGAHQTRAFLRWHRDQGHSTAILFVDLQEAFYRVLRQLAMPGDFSDHDLAQLASRLGLDSAVLHDLWGHLQEPHALERASLPPSAQRAIRALHSNTHFQLPNQKDFVATSMGTRPGDAYADIVFGFLLARVLRVFEEKLMHAHVLSEIPIQMEPALFGREINTGMGSQSFLGPVWMDDMALCLWGASNDGLRSKIGVATSLLLDLFRSHAMTPNLRPGKTELLISPKGQGSRAWRREMFGPLATEHFTALGEYGPYDIHLVTKYVHLGGVLHHSGEVRLELNRRVALAHQAFGKHRKLIYQNRALPLEKRTEIFRSLILSRLLYGSDSWVLKDILTKHRAHVAIMKLYRRFLGCAHDDSLSDDAVLFRLQMPSPTNLLRLARLRYLGSLCSIGDIACWGLLNQDYRWKELVEDDFGWLWHNLSNTCQLGDPRHHIGRWLEILVWHRSYWKSLLRRAERHAIAQHALRFQCKTFHMKIRDLLEAEGYWHADKVRDVADDLAPHYGCMRCQLRLKTKGGEGAHMCRTHRKINPVRYYISGTQCMACLREYHTLGQIQAHLLRSEACRAYLLQHRLRGQALPGIGSTEDTERRHHHDGKLPPLQASGPLMPRRGGQELSRIDWHLHDELALAILDAQQHSDVEALRLRMKQIIMEQEIAWTYCKLTLGELRQTVQDEALGWGTLSKEQTIAILHSLMRPDAWPFLMKSCTTSKSPALSLEDMEQECATCPLRCPSPEDWRVPRPCGTHQIVLHAFSGRRRRGDLQFYMEQIYDRFSEGVYLTVVSLDIVVDRVFGDVTVEETQQFWFSHASRGEVAAFLCGPPCETWSKARFVQTEHFERGPRPVRSAQDLWGLSSLSLRELAQVRVGNNLLCFSLEMLFRLALVGAFGVLEHPEMPEDETMPSIWRLDVMQWLLQMPGVHSFGFSQGLLGAPSPKPTRLLVLNMDGLMGELRRHHLSADLPRRSAIGKAADGSWCTGVLKEYPPAMSRALAAQFCSSLSACPFDASVQHSAAFVQKCQAMDTKVYGSIIGQDFAQ